MWSVGVLAGDDGTGDDGSGDDGDGDGGFDAWRRRMPPDNEIPGTVPVDVVVSRSRDVAVALRSVSLFGNGALLDLAIRLRQEAEPAVAVDPYSTLPQDLLIGIELADGTRVVADGGGPALGAPAQGEAGPTLQFHGGGGGGREYDIGFWLTPSPPPGDLVVVVASVPLGLPESRAVIPASALAAAARRRTVLWPREPDRPPARPPAAMPPAPPGGWFDHVRGSGLDPES